MHEKNLALIRLLNECAAECNHCMAACLDEQDVTLLAKCIKLEISCAEICRLTAGFLARGTEQAEQLAKSCAEICDACAIECEKHKHMEHCRRCAIVCRTCAEECILITQAMPVAS